MPKIKSMKTRRSRTSPQKKNKPESKITAIGQALRSLGGLGGGMVGGAFGHPGLGTAAGTGLGAAVSRWMGQGDYTLTSNSLVNKFRTSGDIPNMHATGQAIVVRHKEYLSDVFSSTAFSVSQTIPLNPGLAGSFPWLSTIAQQFQEYTWKGLIFEYVSTSGDVVASSNTALGSIMLATQYRATAPVYTNKQQLLNEYFSSDAKPSEGFCHPIECNPAENPYNIQYVRSGAVPAGEDQKTYDLGVTYLATVGMQAGAVDIGELWVTYEVELRKPIISGDLNLAGLAAVYVNSSGVAAATPFGTAPMTKVVDTIGLSFTSTTMTIPVNIEGVFFYEMTWGSAVTNSNLVNWVNNATFVNCSCFMNGSSPGTQATSFSVGTTNAIGITYLTVTNPNLIATFTPAPVTLTGATQITVRMFQAPGTLNLDD